MMDNEKIIKIEALKDFCTKALIKMGMDTDYARITAEVLAETDGFGTHSHGTKNLYNYIRKIRASGINLHAVPEIVKDGPAYALVDAHAAIGMIPAYMGMEIAIKKAAECGVSSVCVTNSTHFGAAGYYANMAAKKNMIGLCMSNVDANMTIPGARGKVVGNNPFSYAAPAGSNPPLFLDIAMSSVASLKVVQARKDGRTIPETWIVDCEGLPTTDPGHYPEEGAMQPMAAHKGYGLALMVEILTGVLSGGGMMMEVPSWLFNMQTHNDVSHMFIVIDISKFMDLDTFNQRMETVVARLHETPRAKGTDRIYYPGEIEWEKRFVAAEQGLKLPADVVQSLMDLERESGVAIEWL
jgi:ureidoglycolate dehydrogenase (NAD+)